MKRILRHRPSPSMVVALTALVVASTGTAIAARSLVSGNNLIKKGSLSGNRLVSHSVTGTQIKLSKLGTVPNATTAGNAESLGGQPASAYLKASHVQSSGLVKMTGSAIGNTQTLLTDGPFTFTGTCTKTGAGTTDQIKVTSSDPQSDLNGNITTSLVLDAATPATKTPANSSTRTAYLVTSGGAHAHLLYNHGLNPPVLAGTDCYFMVEAVS